MTKALLGHGSRHNEGYTMRVELEYNLIASIQKLGVSVFFFFVILS